MQTQLHLQDDYRSWLGTSPFLALNMVVVADVWKNTSIVAFFLLAGLQTIPRELYEAARVDGAGAVGSFFRITLPLLTPTIAIVLVLRTIEAFKVFDIIYVMTGGGPAGGTQTITFLTYLQAFSAQRFSYGSAVMAVTAVTAAAYATREYLHGHLEAAGPGRGALLFGAGRELALAADLAGYGCTVVLVTDASGDLPAHPNLHVVRLPGLPGLAGCVLDILPVQLAVHRLAEISGTPIELRHMPADTKLP